MSFQACIDNIKTKTGKSPEDFKIIADKKGLLKEGVKAGEIVAWHKKDFDLGHAFAVSHPQRVTYRKRRNWFRHITVDMTLV